ncbi:MAG: hypothetical protein IPH13_17885 [Planctomycetes bacterium]|nr:hypothetical protein [Planctomycetota bacterium]MCC7170216.1 hypothetical protein [Planctomycetota bacterium]
MIQENGHVTCGVCGRPFVPGKFDPLTLHGRTFDVSIAVCDSCVTAIEQRSAAAELGSRIDFLAPCKVAVAELRALLDNGPPGPLYRTDEPSGR